MHSSVALLCHEKRTCFCMDSHLPSAPCHCHLSLIIINFRISLQSAPTYPHDHHLVSLWLLPSLIVITSISLQLLPSFWDRCHLFVIAAISLWFLSPLCNHCHLFAIAAIYSQSLSSLHDYFHLFEIATISLQLLQSLCKHEMLASWW